MTPAEARRAHDVADYIDLIWRKSNQSPVTKGSGLGAPTHVPRNGDK